MRTIIAGSRTISDLRLLEDVIKDSGFIITEVLCGGARGVDDLGRKWAGNGNLIPVKMFPANWEKYGKCAGIIRNIEMAKNADALIALWDGQSRGTQHMITVAKRRNLQIHVHIVGE